MDDAALDRHQWVTVLMTACLCAAIVALGLPWPA